MSTVFTVLTILVIIASVLITLIVLLQNGKGGGLASNFVTGNQTFGVRQTADILEKITWGLVIFVFAVSIVSSFVLGGGDANGNSQMQEIEQKAQESQAATDAASTLPVVPVAGATSETTPVTAETDK